MVKYTHKTPRCLTAVLEQENSQTKIRIQGAQAQLEEGLKYRFEDCYCKQPGWVYSRPQDPQPLEEQQVEPLSISAIARQLSGLANFYISTSLRVLSVEGPRVVDKSGTALQLTVLRCFSEDLEVEVLLWNREAGDLAGRWALFSGFRVKPLSVDSFVLVSTVYSRLQPLDVVRDNFDPARNYKNLSCLYQPATIADLQERSRTGRQFSRVAACVKGVSSFTYLGCSQCKKKCEQDSCPACGAGTALMSVGSAYLEDHTGWLEVLIFDPHIQSMFTYKQSSFQVVARIKSILREGEQVPSVTHVVSAVDSISF